MNLGLQNSQQSNDPSAEEMARAMKQSRKTPIIIVFAALGAIAVSGGLYVLSGRSAVAAQLQDRGLTDVHVTVEGPFSFSFTGKRGESVCTGSVHRVPFSTSVNEGCETFSTAPAPAPRPPRKTTREELEASLRKNYSDSGFDKFSCGEVGTEDVAMCSMSAGSDPPLTVSASVTSRDTDGSWSKWEFKPARTFLTRTDFAKQLEQEIHDAWKKKGREVTLAVDCGTGGPVIFGDEPFECSATSPDRPGAHGKISLKFGSQEGGYSWKLTGL
jgi:hypothetical protein